MKILKLILLIATLNLISIPLKANTLLLVLANDSSASVSSENYRLQMQGYADALENPELDHILQSYDEVRIIIFEWASRQELIVPCQVLNASNRSRIINTLRNREHRGDLGSSTGIGLALEYAYIRGTECMPNAEIKIVDISGDGVSNIGILVSGIRDIMIADNWTINVLCIIGDEGDISNYFRNTVQGGFGSFTLVAEGFANFSRAIRRKLIFETSQGSNLWQTVSLD